jgi:spore germination protein
MPGVQNLSSRRPVRALVSAFLLCVCGLGPFAAIVYAEGPVKPVFKEVWAYLMRGEEGELTGVEPVTDICLFGASLNKDGRITEKIARPEIVLRSGVKPAVHLVVAELSNASLMHFSLDPQYGVRPLLIEDICRLAESFDGVQIDFESVSGDDAGFFFDFLAALKGRLPPGKVLSVAVPARTESISNDAYAYARIAAVADRIIIMAYDEHWSTSAPGPVASLPWCAKVVDYARSTDAKDKIVMGLPLYGRAWQDKRLARALRFKNVQDIIAEKNSKSSYASELGAYFEYSENVVVKVFYDDDRSIMEKLLLYKAKSVDSVSFWRIGLGPPGVWNGIDNGASRNIAAAEASPSPALPE